MYKAEAITCPASLTRENARLRAELRLQVDELRGWRARLAGAIEAERRRIERDLHDGIQGRLVSVAISLGLLEAKLADDPAAARPTARQARRAIAAALEELRLLTQGVFPSVLVERGLALALEELCDAALIPSVLSVSLEARPPVQLETAAYFVASEATTNAVKHSHATELRVTALCSANGPLIVEVIDNGIGGAAEDAGSGLRGLRDRVEALGGRVIVSSPPGRGTMIRAELPAAHSAPDTMIDYGRSTG
jgi:signal transduction histidine kinase